jgi:hypothetical protein
MLWDFMLRFKDSKPQFALKKGFFLVQKKTLTAFSQDLAILSLRF